MYGVCFIWYKCSCYVSSGCFGGNIISLRWENFLPSFFANTFDNKGNSCCQILLIAVWIKARLLRENKKWIQTDLSSISWHSDRSMAPTCTRLKRLFKKKNSKTNTTDTWRWHVCDKNSTKLIFTFHFSKKNVLPHESMSYVICVFIHGDAILMKDVDDLILRWRKLFTLVVNTFSSM